MILVHYVYRDTGLFPSYGYCCISDLYFWRCIFSSFALVLKGQAHADLAKKKKKICMHFYLFIYDYYVALISALVLLKCGNLRINVLV